MNPHFYAYWSDLERAQATVIERTETDWVYHPNVSGKPRLARAEGMARDTTSGLGPWLNLAALVWAMSSLLLILGGLWDGLRQGWLIKRGHLVSARLLESYETTKKQRGKTVHGLELAYTAPDGSRHEIDVKTSTPGPSLQSPEAVPLLVHPRRPGRAVLPDSLPGWPKINAGGTVELAGRVVWAKLLLWPFLGSLGFGLFALFWVGSAAIYLIL